MSLKHPGRQAFLNIYEHNCSDVFGGARLVKREDRFGEKCNTLGCVPRQDLGDCTQYAGVLSAASPGSCTPINHFRAHASMVVGSFNQDGVDITHIYYARPRLAHSTVESETS